MNLSFIPSVFNADTNKEEKNTLSHGGFLPLIQLNFVGVGFLKALLIFPKLKESIQKYHLLLVYPTR
ncbi:hypothetical protein [Sporosarcina limicola]|uniref:Uncharacterized protein n=1 Tax=Sporosarcina limicola TaxID=34101 RepID=A0A927MMX6_9BACL|nr:hypothetical protein [Sporosarcina limicola]MBE1556903.1 hypothetical protein [Sporosarcina limicola]